MFNLWLNSYRYRSLPLSLVTVIARLKIGKLILGTVLWLVGYHYDPFMFGKLPLGHVLWLQKRRYGLFYGWKVTIVARFTVGKLPL